MKSIIRAQIFSQISDRGNDIGLEIEDAVQDHGLGTSRESKEIDQVHSMSSECKVNQSEFLYF